MNSTANNPPFKNTEELNRIAALFPEEIRMMLATLKMSQLGGLSVAECENLELQEKLFEYFRLRLAAFQIYLYPFEVNDKHLNLVKSLTELTDRSRFKNLELTGKYKAIVFFVHGLEKLSTEDRDRFFKLLNFLRDRLTYIAQPVVIWARPAYVTEMARHAPDFWNWKGALFSFPSDSFELAATRAKHPGKQGSIQRYIDEVMKDPDFAVWSDLYLPLKAVRISETVNLITTRHTFTDEELSQLLTVFPNAVEEKGAKEIVFQKGDIGTGCYVLLNGEVEVFIPDALGNEIIISHLSRGDFFGEIALIKNILRTATVRTVSPCQYIVLTKRQLRQAATKITHLLELMGETAERRLEAIVRAPPDVMSPLRRFANQGSLIRPIPTDVFDLTHMDKRTIILGEAGTGKTTVLRALTLDLLAKAQALLEENTPVDLPIFLRLNALTPGKQIEDLILDVFQGYGIVKFESNADIKKLLKGQVKDAFPVNEFVFLMDGLNETKDKTSRQILNEFIRKHPQHRFIISCRVQDYILIQGFRTALLQGLTSRDIETFLVKYMGQERGKKVAREIHNDPQLMDLAQTPLALYMFTQVTQKGTESLPKNRGILFDRFTDNLLERTDSEWWKVFGRSRSKTPLQVRKQVLAKLGLAMHEDQVTTYAQERWLTSLPHKITLDQTSTTAEDLIEELKFSGLIRYTSDQEQNRVEFAHHTYQEFFAALALRDRKQVLTERLNSDTGLRHWYGVVILLYGISQNRTDLYAEILGPDNDYARVWLAAQCLANSGEEIAVATERFEHQLPPEQQFAMLFSVGLASYLLGRYPEALTYLLRASEVQPGNAQVQYELGSLYRQLDQFKRAIHHLEEAIHLRPDFVDAYNQLGITYYDQEKYEEALTIFAATTQLEPANPHHYYNLGLIQKVLKDYEAARNTFQIAVQIKKDYTEARVQLDLLEKALASGVVRVLKTIPMLSKLTLEQTIMLANRLKVTEYKAGQIIFHMGEMGDTFYIIEYGTVEVLVPDIHAKPGVPQKPAVINLLKAGDFFGEIALLRAVPRTATIRCAADVRLLELNREDFKNIIEHHPSIAHNLAETSSYRLLQDRQSGRRSDFDYYYDPNYLQELLQRQDEVTVLMGDIHGSTFLTNAIGPELMVEFLDEYLLRMSTIVVNAGGAMDKSLGDSVMGVFGHFPERPSETPISPAVRSVLAALQMRQAYLDLREEWKSRSPMFTKTGMGIGISTGPVRIGTVGAEGAMVGAAVNFSNKLSKMAIKGRDESEIYLDAKTYKMLGETIEVEKLDPGYVIGKAGGVELEAHRVVRNIALKLEADF